MRYFYSSFLITFLAIFIAFWLGGLGAAYICALLCILEISLSFDNAVVNARILRDLSPLWQRRFIVWGIPVAVFGMRFIFPVIIVSIAASLGLWQTLNLAINDPEHYHEILSSCKDAIYVFGGAFLMMVFLDFFFDDEDREAWIRLIEQNFAVNFLKKLPFLNLFISLLFGGLLWIFSSQTRLILAYFGAVGLYFAIKSFDRAFGKNGARNGVAGFLYLESLDASFSFDGVIGAFALSENIFIIMLGLGAGAMFVRSITLYLVSRGTLAKFVFLEHGAHYAILCLAVIMFAKLKFEISEIITGTIGIAFILASFVCSVLYNRKSEN